LREFSINCLTLDESLLLARQLPNLQTLFQREQDRQLVREVLALVQGHPKLLEMADRRATDPHALRQHVRDARKTGGGGTLDAFFRTGESGVDDSHMVATLGAWTASVTNSLAAASRRCFQFLCCLEEADRCLAVARQVWQPEGRGRGAAPAAEDWTALARNLEEVGLLELREDGGAAPGSDAGKSLYYIHAGVAETGRAGLPAAGRRALDRKLAKYWTRQYREAVQSDITGGSAEVVRRGLSAAPYLMRLGHWEEAADILEEVRYRDDSPEVAARLLAYLGRIESETRSSARHARVLRIYGSILLDAGELMQAEKALREAAARSEEAGKYKEASVALDEMIDLLRRTGRAKDALDTVERMKGYTKKARLGPWSRLVDETWRLQLLHDIGEEEAVLAAFDKLDAQMENLRENAGHSRDPAPSWAAREFLFEVGRLAALERRDWERALQTNGRAIRSQIEREASALEIAEVKFKDYLPLLRRGDFEQARELILDCRMEFERGQSDRLIGESFAALAALEQVLGHVPLAIDHETTALRYRYKQKEPEDCARGHLQLAGYLALVEKESAMAGAHRAAGALIRYRTWAGEPDALARRLHSAENAASARAPLPAGFDQLCELVERTEGVFFRSFFLNLPACREKPVEHLFASVAGILRRGAKRAAAR
jgi:tetratricopeptide (TPR) repeat protein